jgi:hypothetical protein
LEGPLLKYLLFILADLGLKYLIWILSGGEVLFPEHEGDQAFMFTIYTAAVLMLGYSIWLLKRNANKIYTTTWFALMIFQLLLFIFYSMYSRFSNSSVFLFLNWDYLLWELVVPSLLISVQLIFYLVYSLMKIFKWR